MATRIAGAFATMARARPQAVLVPLSRIAEAGSLMTYGPNQEDLYRRGAIYVDKILRCSGPRARDARALAAERERWTAYEEDRK